jgi:hypothetical protein
MSPSKFVCEWESAANGHVEERSRLKVGGWAKYAHRRALRTLLSSPFFLYILHTLYNTLYTTQTHNVSFIYEHFQNAPSLKRWSTWIFYSFVSLAIHVLQTFYNINVTEFHYYTLTAFKSKYRKNLILLCLKYQPKDPFSTWKSWGRREKFLSQSQFE